MIPAAPTRAREGRRLKSIPAGYRALVVATAVVIVLVVGGTVGYMVVEGWGAFDSLYMTVITLTSVGYLEVHPLTTAGRVFTMGLLLTGVFSLFYTATSAVSSIVGGELTGQLDRSRMEKKLHSLRDHVIICGYGRMGRLVANEFAQQKIPFVVIERSAELLQGFSSGHGVALAGDATHDDTLRRAGIDRARTLVTVAASDADNLFITMSARLMSEKVFIVARAEDEAAEKTFPPRPRPTSIASAAPAGPDATASPSPWPSPANTACFGTSSSSPSRRSRSRRCLRWPTSGRAGSR